MVPLSEFAHLIQHILLLPITQLHVNLETLLRFSQFLLDLKALLAMLVVVECLRGS